MKKITLAIISVSLLFITSCSGTTRHTKNEQDNSKQSPFKKSLRTITLGGHEFSETQRGDISSWKCRHYFDGGKVLVEVGQIALPFPEDLKETDEYLEIEEEAKFFFETIFSNDSLSFILYDGTNSGDIALYRRDGLNQRWDWFSSDFETTYSFIIEPDGTGLYYDFSTADDGRKSKADGLYKCGN